MITFNKKVRHVLIVWNISFWQIHTGITTLSWRAVGGMTELPLWSSLAEGLEKRQTPRTRSFVGHMHLHCIFFLYVSMTPLKYKNHFDLAGHTPADWSWSVGYSLPTPHQEPFDRIEYFLSFPFRCIWSQNEYLYVLKDFSNKCVLLQPLLPPQIQFKSDDL